MTLDSLHKVMTGESTLDKEMQIGEISHRKDGDWKKVAPGKWAPVKAVGGAKAAGEKKSFTGSGNMAGHKWEAEKVGGKFVVTHTYPDGRTDKTDITKEEYDTMKTNTPAPKKEAGQGNVREYIGTGEHEGQSWKVTQNGDKFIVEFSDPKNGGARAELGKDAYDLFKKITKSYWKEKPAEQKPAETKPELKAEGEGPDTSLQHERNGQIFKSKIRHTIPMSQEDYVALTRIGENFEGGRWVATDAIDNYADYLIQENLEKGNDNSSQERAVMKIAKAIGYDKELHDKIKKARNGYDFGYDDELGSFYEEDNEEAAPKAEGKPEGGANMDKSITDWTTKAKLTGHYKPKNNMTFNELYKGMKEGKDVDKMLGITESETRWRILDELANRTGESIDDIHELWYKNYMAADTDDAAPGIAKKAVELAQRDYTDVPGRVLTADTKVRLSKIKR